MVVTSHKKVSPIKNDIQVGPKSQSGFFSPMLYFLLLAGHKRNMWTAFSQPIEESRQPFIYKPPPPYKGRFPSCSQTTGLYPLNLSPNFF